MSKTCIYQFPYRSSVRYYLALLINLWSAFPYRLTNNICVFHTPRWHGRAVKDSKSCSLVRTARKRSWAGSKTCIYAFPYRLTVGYYSALLISLLSAFPYRLANNVSAFHTQRWNTLTARDQTTRTLVRTARKGSWTRSKTWIYTFPSRLSAGYYPALLTSSWSPSPYQLTNKICVFHTPHWNARTARSQTARSLIRTARQRSRTRSKKIYIPIALHLVRRILFGTVD